MAKDKGGAASKEEREEFGMGEGAGEATKQNPDRSPSTHDAGTGGQVADKTGTPSATPQWPSSQPNRSGK